jgi:hypothetical protein
MDKEVVVTVYTQKAQVMKYTDACNPAKSLKYSKSTMSEHLIYTHSWK